LEFYRGEQLDVMELHAAVLEMVHLESGRPLLCTAQQRLTCLCGARESELAATNLNLRVATLSADAVQRAFASELLSHTFATEDVCTACRAPFVTSRGMMSIGPITAVQIIQDNDSCTVSGHHASSIEAVSALQNIEVKSVDAEFNLQLAGVAFHDRFQTRGESTRGHWTCLTIDNAGQFCYFDNVQSAKVMRTPSLIFSASQAATWFWYVCSRFQ